MQDAADPIMAATDPSDKTMQICPRCQQPLTPGVKFCEACGEKVVQSPVCPHCGKPLRAGAKFCEFCGKSAESRPAPPVAPVAAAPAPVEIQKTSPAPEPVVEEPPRVIVPEIPAVPAAEPASPQPAIEVEKPPSRQEPATIPVQAGTADTSTGAAPASRTRILVIAGIIGVILIAALAFVFVLPMLSPSGPGSTQAPGLSLPGLSPQPSAAPTVSAASTPAVSFEPKPTQTLPVNLEVTYQAERNPITGVVTVTFTGGAGMNGISSTTIILTKSDGTVVTESFKPQRVGDYKTLKGTLKTDRIEVIANFYNGDSYRVLDRLFEYKQKN